MPYNSPSPHTVDIDATESATSFQRPLSHPAEIRSVVSQSLSVDAFAVFVSLLLGVLLSGAVGAVKVTEDIAALPVLPPRWFIFGACVVPALLWVFVDVLSALSNPAVLPFARSRAGVKAVYAKRMHLLLLAFYFTSILVALCWSALPMLLVSKIFVAAVFAIALFALGQSIPSRRLSFIVSGILFLVVLFTTQAFIVLKLEADSTRANQEVLNELNPSQTPIKSPDEQFLEERGE